jgi:hypothetical protein
MITIFHGRTLSFGGSEDVVYAQVAVALRDQIHHFNTGRNCNPFAVFMKIALHADQYGWAFPSSASISAGTGISTAHALAAARAHLLNVRIDGHRVLAIYRQRRPDGTFGRHLYRIFPEAWPDALDHLPDGFAPDRLSPLTPGPAGDPHGARPPVAQSPAGKPPAVQPPGAQPHVAQRHADYPQPKKNQETKKNQGSSKSRSGSAGTDRSLSPFCSAPRTTQAHPPPPPPPHPTPNPQSPNAAPPIRDQPPPATTFTPCALARFIAAHSGYRFPPGEQHERLLHPVPHGDGAHPAPAELFREPGQREAFQAWVLDKIAWAEGDGGPRKPLKALVSALRNYAQPRYGWFVYWNAWSPREGGRYERRSTAPGYGAWPGSRAEAAGHEAWPGGRGASPRGEARAASQQRHWQQVAAILDQARSPLG